MTDIVERRLPPLKPLPSCMMPDGAQPCEAFSELEAEIERLENELKKAHRLIGQSIQWQHDAEIVKVKQQIEIEWLQQQIVHLKRTIDVMKAPGVEG